MRGWTNGTPRRGPSSAALHGRLVRLRRRLRVLDAARGCGALGGAAICVATFALFLGGLQNAAVASVLFISFGASRAVHRRLPGRAVH